MDQGDLLEVISIAPSGRPGRYGVRLIWKRARSSTAICDAIYDQHNGTAEVLHVEGGAQGEKSLEKDVAALLSGLAGEGEEARPFAFLKLDIVSHSRISTEFPQRETDATWDAFAQLVKEEVSLNAGDLWTWQGDGGLCAFVGSEKESRAVRCVAQILERLKQFNALPEGGNKLNGEHVVIRAAVHSGLARERINKGEIHSRDINFVAHLEAQRTCPNTLSASREAFVELDRKLQRDFRPVPDRFEGREIYTTAPLDDFETYIRTRQANTDELERELALLRQDNERLLLRLDTGLDISILRALRAEASENTRSMQNEKHVSTPLNSTAWNQYKGELSFMEDDLMAQIEEIYVEIQHINQLCREHAALGAARLRASSARSIGVEKQALLPSLQKTYRVLDDALRSSR